MKSIIVGSVGSSKLVLEQMIENKFPIDMVFSLDEKYSGNVSGYYPLHELAKKNNIPYMKYKNINDGENIEIIRKINPDYIFVIGLSQLVKQEIINLAKIGVIGYHPTALPKYRGRAAVVWQILLGIKSSKVTLFKIDEGMDSGEIIGQKEYFIEETDYISDVGKKTKKALKELIGEILPKMKSGKIPMTKQDENEATYLLKRTPEDGKINWENSIEDIHRLIRAVSKPYPGSFAMYECGRKVIFWRAEKLPNNKYIGIPGQIANISNDYFDVVCKDGLLRVTDYQSSEKINLKIGSKFQ